MESKKLKEHEMGDMIPTPDGVSSYVESQVSGLMSKDFQLSVLNGDDKKHLSSLNLMKFRATFDDGTGEISFYGLSCEGI